MDQACDASGQGPGPKREEEGQGRVHGPDEGQAVCNADGGKGCAQGKCPIHGKIWKVQDLIGDIYAQRHDGINQAFFKDTENNRCHSVPPKSM